MTMTKKTITTGAILAGIIFITVSGSIISNRMHHGEHAGEQAGQAVYYCPMHPTYTSDKPGNCPICTMKLVKAEATPQTSHSSHGHAVLSAEEKSLDEICIMHKCNKKDCPMSIKAHVKPGERLVCPVCGEVIIAESGKAVVVSPGQAARAKDSLTYVVTPGPAQERKILYYRNPMDPQVTSPVPMKDPMGMDYVPVYEQASSGTESGGSTVTISPEKQQLIGITTEPVRMVDLVKVVRASGKIAYDPELAVTQEEFIQALNVQDSIKDSPLADVVQRAKSMAEAARSKLKLLGMSDEQINALASNRKSDTSLYLPGAGESLWAYISVYEYEIGLIKPGAMVDIEAVAYPGEEFPGTVVSISPVLDAVTRTNQVRVAVQNPGSKLKPEMFVSGSIKVDLGEKLAVPEKAVLDTGLRKIVYLSRENDTLESREVTLGQKAQGYYEVLEGLSAGDVVVTSGNFLVDSESRLQNPAQPAEHNHGQ